MVDGGEMVQVELTTESVGFSQPPRKVSLHTPALLSVATLMEQHVDPLSNHPSQEK